ncbi:MAG: VOC family protein [Candidatus Limnocylindrales bacterium]
MTLRVPEVVIDCADHGAVVDFWAAALGYERAEFNEQYVGLAPVERLRGLGATFIAERSLGALRWTVMADPEGNEFCVSGDAWRPDAGRMGQPAPAV